MEFLPLLLVEYASSAVASRVVSARQRCLMPQRMSQNVYSVVRNHHNRQRGCGSTHSDALRPQNHDTAINFVTDRVEYLDISLIKKNITI